MWTREMLKTNAKHVLKRNYWIPFAVCLIVTLLCGDWNPSRGSHMEVSYHAAEYGNWNVYTSFLPISIPFYLVSFGIFLVIGSILLNVFVFNPLKVGKARFFIENIDREASIGDLFKVFSTPGYLNIVKVMIVRDIKLFLWALCFVIPGIIKSYEYYMVPYIIAEDPTLSCEEVFAVSRELTTNQKVDIFVLNLSFIGWLILGSLLFGIGVFFVNPYIEATDAELYRFLKYAYVHTGYE